MMSKHGKKVFRSYLKRHEEQKRKYERVRAGKVGGVGGYILSQQPKQEMIDKLRALGYVDDARKLEVEVMAKVSD